uniref:Uncharacterized protein n=1 Tax=Meloidogyne incognita TaxID=6306 RepID=A0A914LNS4_MELIC
MKFSDFTKHFTQRVFLDAFSSFEGTIDLVWDGKKMMRLLNLIVTPNLLSQNLNVGKNYSLNNPGYSNAANLGFLLYATQTSIELVKSWLRKLDDRCQCSVHLFFIPEKTYTLTERLKDDKSVWDKICTIKSLPVNWFPSEQPSLISMDLPQLPPQLFINGDWNFLFQCAKALKQLVDQFNRLPNFYSKGKWSLRILEIMKKQIESTPKKALDSTKSEFRNISDVVLIDRWIDPLTPMLRQSTFGGVCDELFGIDSRGIIKIPAEESSDDKPDKSKKEEFEEIQLNDQVYEQLQDLSVGGVALKLREIVDELKGEELQRKSLDSVAQYKNFIAKLPNVVVKRKSTGIFMRLAGVVQQRESDDFYRGLLRCEQEIMRNPQHDKIHPFIENSLIEMREINSILRLIILQSLISNGLKSSVLQTYTKLIVQSYGISELKLLLKLQLAGLVKDENFCEKRWDVSYTPGNFNQLIRKYKFALTDLEELRKSEVKIGKPSLLIRIIEEGLQKEWIDFNKTLMETTTENNSNFQQKDEENKQTLIFVIGGITRAEMSILNSLPFKIFCCTTDFMNSNDLINSFRF